MPSNAGAITHDSRRHFGMSRIVAGRNQKKKATVKKSHLRTAKSSPEN
jgi:hypothetical protein